MTSRFEELRNKLGLSRREIHEATGISKNTLLLYEKGATPSIPQIEKIAKTYNINPAWLAGWSNDDRQPQTIEKVVEKLFMWKRKAVDYRHIGTMIMMAESSSGKNQEEHFKGEQFDKENSK